MLIIRNDQMAALGVSRFTERMAELLREEFVEVADVQVDKLKEELRRQIEKAADYGLESEQHVAAFVITAWLMGKDFDRTYEAAGHVLASQEFTADDKTVWLEDWVDAIFSSLEEEEN